MKKKLLYLALGLSVLVYGCKKKSDPGQEVDDPFELEYSNNTIEQDKAELEKAGTDFIKEFNSLPDEPFIDVFNSFASLNLDGINTDDIGVNSVNKIKLAASSKNLKLFVSTQDDDSDVAKLSDLYGIYTWSPNDDEFIKSSSSDKVEFRFPSVKGGKTNDATLTFTYQASMSATIDGENIELPKKSTTTLKKGSNSLMSINTNHEYKSDGTPTKSNVVITMGAFEMSTAIINDGQEASVSYAIKKSGKSLVSITASATGKGSVGAVVNDEDDLINKGNVSLQVMNYKFTGTADIKSIINEIDAVSDPTALGKANKEAAIFNKYAKLVAVNTSNNVIIAQLEMKGSMNQHCYDYEEWDGQNLVIKTDCHEDSEVVPNLIFKDGSKQSFDEFGETGFKSVIDEFDKLINRF